MRAEASLSISQLKSPKGVPEENWLPINRKDENLDVIMRVYQPELEKMKTWKVPRAEKLWNKASKQSVSADVARAPLLNREVMFYTTR